MTSVGWATFLIIRKENGRPTEDKMSRSCVTFLTLVNDSDESRYNFELDQHENAAWISGDEMWRSVELPMQVMTQQHLMSSWIRCMDYTCRNYVLVRSCNTLTDVTTQRYLTTKFFWLQTRKSASSDISMHSKDRANVAIDNRWTEKNLLRKRYLLSALYDWSPNSG
jgi:hypothetical protein